MSQTLAQAMINTKPAELVLGLLGIVITLIALGGTYGLKAIKV